MTEFKTRCASVFAGRAPLRGLRGSTLLTSVSLGALLASTPACTTTCYDDGFAWSLSKAACEAITATATVSDTETTMATETATMTATITATVTVTASATDSDTEGPASFCRDADTDGQGDPDDCVMSSGGAPEGYVDNDDARPAGTLARCTGITRTW